MAANCGNMAHITQGVSTKMSTVKSELHISRASEEVTSPRRCLGCLGRWEREQSSAKRLCKNSLPSLCIVSTQLQKLPSPSKHFSSLPRSPPHMTWSGIKDASGFPLITSAPASGGGRTEGWQTAGGSGDDAEIARGPTDTGIDRPLERRSVKLHATGPRAINGVRATATSTPA